jgi:hypothetical protein
VNKQVLVVGLIAVLIVGAVVGSILFSTRHNRVELHGSVLKVRSHSVDAGNTVVIADIRVTNPSTQQFVVEEVEVYIDEEGGEPVKGDVFSEVDANRLLEYYPVLGARYNPNLMIRQKINPGETIDRMIAARFPGIEERFQQRKGMRIVVTDVDGMKTEIPEKR